MALTKADYKEMGKKSAARGEALSACTLREGSWQSDAYREGWFELQCENGPGVKFKRSDFEGMPQAAAEHVSILMNTIVREPLRRERCERLIKKCYLILKRHRAPAGALAALQQPTTN